MKSILRFHSSYILKRIEWVLIAVLPLTELFGLFLSDSGIDVHNVLCAIAQEIHRSPVVADDPELIIIIFTIRRFMLNIRMKSISLFANLMDTFS